MMDETAKEIESRYHSIMKVVWYMFGFGSGITVGAASVELMSPSLLQLYGIAFIVISGIMTVVIKREYDRKQNERSKSKPAR